MFWVKYQTAPVGEVPVLENWEMMSLPFLPLLTGLLKLGMVVPFWVPSTYHPHLLKYYVSIGPYAKKKKKEKEKNSLERITLKCKFSVSHNRYNP